MGLIERLPVQAGNKDAYLKLLKVELGLKLADHGLNWAPQYLGGHGGIPEHHGTINDARQALAGTTRELRNAQQAADGLPASTLPGIKQRITLVQGATSHAEQALIDAPWSNKPVTYHGFSRNHNGGYGYVPRDGVGKVYDRSGINVVKQLTRDARVQVKPLLQDVARALDATEPRMKEVTRLTRTGKQAVVVAVAGVALLALGVASRVGE